MHGASAGSKPWRTLLGCGLVAGILGEMPVHAGGPEPSHAARARRPRPTLEDQIPDLKTARRGARERHGRPECQAVLTDFESVNGGRLDEVLRASGRTAQEQLDRMVLQSGLGRHVCDRAVTMASTSVHSSLVLICLRPFALLRPMEQEAILIHEMLHSLGLGENPPESVVITERVMSRCGH